MGIVAKLTKGTSYLDLNSGRYGLAGDFVPPSTSIAPYLGISGQKLGEAALPRDWSFTVRVLGGSSAEVKRGADDLANFLRLAGDEAQPLYFEWREDSNVSSEPVWGQFGATRRLEITHGTADYWGEYAAGPNIKDRVAFVTAFVTVKPWAQGTRQLLAEAKGGIVEDWIGTTDGRSRGIQIPEADETNGNKFTNPMFGHGTWDTGWTAAADLNDTRNTDPEYVLFGLNSAKLAAGSAVLGNNTYTQSIAAGNTNPHMLSCYAKRADGGVISIAQCQLWYNGALGATYYPVGNGWYRLLAGFNGIAAATPAGVLVQDMHTVYVDGFQLEERAYATPFFYGDMLGNHWSGTAHASTTHRETAYLRLPTADLLNSASGTIRVVWKADRSNTEYTADAFLLYSSANFGLYFEDGADTWVAEAAGASSDIADTFSVGDIVVLHMTWEPTGVTVYLNGVSGGTAVGSALTLLGTYLYIGSNDGPSGHIGGMVMDLAIHHHVLTATEILADYTNAAQLIADGQFVGSIPYIWSRDGSNAADYCDTGIYRNIITIGGIGGDGPAKAEIKMVTAGLNDADVYIGRLDFPYAKHLDPEFLSYIPAAPPDTISVNNVDVTLATISLDDDEFELVSGRRVGLMLRVDDAAGGNNVIIKTGVNPGGAYYYSDQLATTWITTDALVSIDLTPEIFIVPNENLYRELGITRAVTLRAVGQRTAAGALDFKLHAAQIMPFPLTRFVNTSAAGIAVTILYIDGKAYEVNSSALSYAYTVRGDKIEFTPGRYNWLVSYLGREAVATDTGDRITYSRIYVTPRWLIA